MSNKIKFFCGVLLAIVFAFSGVSAKSVQAQTIHPLDVQLQPRHICGTRDTLWGTLYCCVTHNDYYGWGFESLDCYDLYITGPNAGDSLWQDSLEIRDVSYTVSNYGKLLTVRIQGRVRNTGLIWDDIYPFDETYVFDYYGY